MDINDKLGKDRAQELENFFITICGDRPGIKDIARNTSMYKFLNGKNTVEGFTSMDGLREFKPYTYKIKRSEKANRILHQITLDQYLFEEVVDQEEYDNLKAMLNSPDMENATMVEMLFEVKHRPLWQKKRAILKRKLKKIFNGI